MTIKLVGARELFAGHEPNECGEHALGLRRAWCHICTEWCYPHAPCKGCELPQLRAELERARAENAGDR